MPKPYPLELRTRVVDTYQRGEGTFEEMAELFQIGVATVNRWWSRFRETHSVEPQPHGGGQPPKVDERGLRSLKKWLVKKSDLTLEELIEKYEKKFDVRVSSSAMSRTLLLAKLTRKKNVPCDGAGH